MTKGISFLALTATLFLAACQETAEATKAPEQPAETASSVSDHQAVEVEVRAFIERYNAYYGANDLDPYFASFDPALTQWLPSGRVDLKGYETSWRRGVAAGGGVAKATVSDLQVQIDPTGDTAIAIYVLEVIPRRDGQPQSEVERYQETDVLFKRDGIWKIVHVHYGPAR